MVFSTFCGQICFSNFFIFFWPQKVEKTTPKSCILMAVWRVFFSAAPTAQNSPELHFSFINSFIQLSRVWSLHETVMKVCTILYFYTFFEHSFNVKKDLAQLWALDSKTVFTFTLLFVPGFQVSTKQLQHYFVEGNLVGKKVKN